jgi:DUF1009 family protein
MVEIPHASTPPRYGLIAGNGRFPFLVLEAARSRGVEMIVAAIKEETFPEIDQAASRVHWLSLGQLGRLIDLFKEHGVTRAVMAGQVKHKQIFSAIRPDWRLVKLLASLATRNTDSLIGGVARVLSEEGIELENSTAFLQPLLATPGTMTERSPDERERGDIDYGISVARHLAAMDIGQTVVVADRACIAVEAMEGTDAVIRRAAALVQDRPLTVVKVAKPDQDLRFDVPVVGQQTIATMAESHATALAVEAGITLLIDRDKLVAAANRARIAIEGIARAGAAKRSAPSGAHA